MEDVDDEYDGAEDEYTPLDDYAEAPAFEQDGRGLFDEPVFEQEGPGLFDEPVPADEASEIAAPQQPGTADPMDSSEAAPASLALYRRYRPDSFSEVIGQEHVTVPLMRALNNNQVCRTATSTICRQ